MNNKSKSKGKRYSSKSMANAKSCRQGTSGNWNTGSNSSATDRTRGPKFSARQRDVESVDMMGKKRLDASGLNDPGWYADSVDLLKAYFSYPFATPLGRNFESGAAALDSYSVPGIMAYYFAPSVGVAQAANDAVNVAAQRIYSFVRHANSGHANYDPTDLMIYLLAMDSAHMYAEYLERVYGTLLTYSKTNWYYPKALLSAMGVDADDLQQHIPDLLGYIQVYVNKISSLAVPSEISYNTRHAWLCRHIWLDSAKSTKAQTYLWVPEKFFKFELSTGDGAGYLHMIDLGSKPVRGQVTNLLTFANLVTFGNNLINPLLAQEDFGIISGDIMKAYPNAYRVATTITEDYHVPLEYSEEVLSQIENTTVFSSVAYNITQYNTTPGSKASNWLVSTPVAYVDTFIPYTPSLNSYDFPALDVYTNGAVALDAKYRALLNMHHDGVTEADVAVASRMTVRLSGLTANGTHFTQSKAGTYAMRCSVDSCGSELCCGAMMFSYILPSAGSSRVLYAFDIPTLLPISYQTANPIGNGAMMYAPNRCAQLATFDWHHGVFIDAQGYTATTTSTSEKITINSTAQPQGIILDVDMFTWIDAENLRAMHEAALINELWYRKS